MVKTTDKHVIIVAGGKGLRMGADLPKQFLPIGGKPVLMHTIQRFRQYDENINIIVVLPHEQQHYWQELCTRHDFTIPHHVADGGATRFHSSWNGLSAISDNNDGLVAIHDGVRPFPAIDTISRCFEAAAQTGAALPVVPVVDTLRHVGQASRTVPRAEYRIVQTPQVFTLSLLRQAFRHAIDSHRDEDLATAFTDDASVVEACGHAITLVDGNRENIKITTPFDLQIAQTLLAAEH